MNIERIGVVGCGIMGSGIAEACARAGQDVMVCEADDAALAAGQRRVERSMEKAERSGKLIGTEREQAFRRLTFTSDLDALRDRDLVVEAVTEDPVVKLDIFSKLDKCLLGVEPIIASNTSSIPIMRLAMATSRPERVIGVHFFNPVPVLDLVELVPTLLTSSETVEACREFTSGTLNKVVILSKDRAGFIVNALLIPFILSAIRMLDSGFATADDIDNGMVEGCRHPIGPLALADLIGLDTTEAVAKSLYEEFKESLYAPPPLLSRMVEAGLLGRKTGRGFFDHVAGSTP